jgi:hypothetical protein
MSDRCEVNLQWKGTNACYDFWCPCGWEGPDDPNDEPTNHADGYFKQDFRCGGCGRWWHLPNRLVARPGKFFRDDGGYGCKPECGDHLEFPAQEPAGRGSGTVGG